MTDTDWTAIRQSFREWMAEGMPEETLDEWRPARVLGHLWRETDEAEAA